METHDIRWAKQQLQAGNYVCREIWDGTSWLALQTIIGSKVLIVRCTASGGCTEYLASTGDLLGEDWRLK